MIDLKFLKYVFFALAAAFSPKGESQTAQKCQEYLEEFIGLGNLARPHLTGVGFVTHDVSAIVRRYKVTTDSLNSQTCRRVLEFVSVGDAEQGRAYEEARRMHFVLKNLDADE